MIKLIKNVDTSLLNFKFFPVETFITCSSNGVPIKDTLKIGKIMHGSQRTMPGAKIGGKNNIEEKSCAKLTLKQEHKKN